MEAPIMVGATPNSLVAVPTPFEISWGSSVVSSPDAGRANDANATMYVDPITTKRTIALSWKNLDGAQTASVLQAFSLTYVFVRYHDPELNAYVVREFHTGNKSAPVRQIFGRNGTVEYKTVSFNIIER